MSKNDLYTSLLFLFFPLLSLPFILRGMVLRKKYAFVLWAIFMGLLGVLYPPVGDIYRYTNDFLVYKECTWNEFCDLMIFKFDYLLSFLSYIIGHLGGNFEVCKFLYNFIAYYLLASIYLDITERKSLFFPVSNIHLSLYSTFFFIAFSLNAYLWRFGLSSVLFVYGTYQLIYCEKKDGWIYVVLAVLNHFSFVLFGGVLCLQMLHFFKFKKWFVVLLTICSLFISGDFLPTVLPYLPSDIVLRYSTYLDGYYASEYIAEHSIKYQIQVFLNSLITYAACLFYLLTYKYEKNGGQGITNGVLLLVCVSLPFDTMHMRFLAVLLLFIKMNFLWCYDGTKRRLLYLKCLFWFVMMGNFIGIWGLRRQIAVSDYCNLLYQSSFQLLAHTYDENWIYNNVSDDGDILKINY